MWPAGKRRIDEVSRCSTAVTCLSQHKTKVSNVWLIAIFKDKRTARVRKMRLNGSQGPERHILRHGTTRRGVSRTHFPGLFVRSGARAMLACEHRFHEPNNNVERLTRLSSGVIFFLCVRCSEGPAHARSRHRHNTHASRTILLFVFTTTRHNYDEFSSTR